MKNSPGDLGEELLGAGKINPFPIPEKDFKPAMPGDYGFLSGNFYHYENSIMTQHRGSTLIFVSIGEGKYRRNGGEDGLGFDLFAFVDGCLQLVQDFDDVQNSDTYADELAAQEQRLPRVVLSLFDEKGEMKASTDWVVREGGGDKIV